MPDETVFGTAFHEFMRSTGLESSPLLPAIYSVRFRGVIICKLGAYIFSEMDP